MREIKYRLRSPIDKIVGYEKWYPGSMDSKNFYIAQPCWLYSKDGEFWNPEKIDHRLKDAFTGLKDKNGKEIFEGDIVGDEGGGQFEIVFQFCAWHFKPTKKSAYISYPTAYSNAKYYKIIGNIYESPELLGKGGVE